jgi:hypothetical protein
VAITPRPRREIITRSESLLSAPRRVPAKPNRRRHVRGGCGTEKTRAYGRSQWHNTAQFDVLHFWRISVTWSETDFRSCLDDSINAGISRAILS